MFGARTTAALLGALLGAVTATAAMAQAACIIYEHDNFRGQSYGFSATGKSDGYGGFWNDRVSSVRVAPGCRLTLFEHSGYRGDRITYEGDISSVGGRWNDRASSSICECAPPRRRDGRGNDWRDPDRRPGPGAGRGDQRSIGNGPPPRLSRRGFACAVFRNQGFDGQWRAFEDGEDDRKLGRRLRERVSSVAVARGCSAELDFGRGYKLLIEQNTARLPNGLNNEAESVSCYCD